MFNIVRKIDIFLKILAILIFTLYDEHISHTYSKSHDWLRLRIFSVAKGAMIFSLLLFPLIVAILACNSLFTFKTNNWFMSEHCADTAFELI